MSDSGDAMDTWSISELDLSVRSYNCLRRAGIATIGDLTSRHESELAAIPNFGERSLRDVLSALEEHGLKLSDVVRSAPRPAVPASQDPGDWSRSLLKHLSASDIRELATDELAAATAALGHPPDRAWWDEVRKLPSGADIIAVFGTWDHALASLQGTKSASENRPSDERTLLNHLAESDVRKLASEQLREATTELGRAPDPEAWAEARMLPSRSDIIAVFGSWDRALASIEAETSTTLADEGDVEDPSHGTQREDLPYRARRVLELREEGRTLDEVGRIFGVTRERIRQIEKQYGGVDPAVVAERAAARLQAGAATHRDRILRLFREGHDIREIARRLEVPPAIVDAGLDAYASRSDRGAHGIARQRRRRVAPTVFSDDDLIAAIRTVADRVGRAPSSGEYGESARALGLPSLPTVFNRFGSWSAAVLAAGLVPRGAGRGNYTRRWTEIAVRTALERLVIELGALPTVDQYELSAATDPRLPSSATVRNRLGRWSMVSAELSAEPSPEELLTRLDADASSAEDRQEQIWLAYIADELSDRDLRVLILSGKFGWDETYGPPPESIVPALETNGASRCVEAGENEPVGDD